MSEVRLQRLLGLSIAAAVATIALKTVGGPGIKAVRRVAKGAGEVVLPIAPDGATWVKLGHTGRATVRARVTYIPTTPGTVVPASRSRRITLLKSQ